jgi:hypothetical protein
MAWLRLILDSDRGNAENLFDLLERFSAVSVSFSAQGDKDLYA